MQEKKKRMTLECFWTSDHMFKKMEKLRCLFSLAEQCGNFMIMGNKNCGMGDLGIKTPKS